MLLPAGRAGQKPKDADDGEDGGEQGEGEEGVQVSELESEDVLCVMVPHVINVSCCRCMNLFVRVPCIWWL